MISDKKRREVAEKLRRQLKYMKRNDDYMKDVNVVEYGNLTYRNIAASVESYGNFIKGNYAHIVELLADLIDRPTCKNVSEFGSHVFTVSNFSKDEYFDFVCGRCGTHLYSDEMEFSPLKDENYELRALHFCPYCGAEVVSND